MKKRWPLIASFLLFIALCASAAYWAMQLFRPPVRAVAAPPPSASRPPPPIEAAAQLLGGRSNIAVATNFQLRGVIASGTPGESIAILSADGKPAQAVRANAEVLPGVLVKEVHPRYVLLSDGGAIKRVELPEGAKGGEIGMAPPQGEPQQPNPAPAAVVPPNPPPSEPPHTPSMGVPPGMGLPGAPNPAGGSAASPVNTPPGLVAQPR